MRPLKEELRDRRLPELMMTQRGEPVVSPLLWEKRRAELLEIMAREEFGFSPEPVPASGRVADGSIKEAYGGKAVEKRFVVTFPTPKGDFSFPLYLAIPSAGRPCPCILLINFRKQIPDEYYPVEEILDAGFATACIYYQDITSDDGNMEDGLAGCFSLSQAGETGMGKIGCWAYAMSRAVDLLLEQPEIRKNAIVTAGHSRLGKTSLWCAAQDQRIAGCISNNAGCSGDAITRGKAGEHVVDITTHFPFWFATSYQRYREREEDMPFDQHFLLAAIAPRPLAVGAAQEDEWADPVSQMLGCMAAAPAWRLLGREAFAEPYEMLRPGYALQNGWIGFHIRSGGHFFSRWDWKQYLAFFAKRFDM